MRNIKKLIFYFLTLSSFLIFPTISFARTYYYPSVKAATVTLTPSPTPISIPAVDSSTLFWPIFAGKTMESKIYFLKTLKEEIRAFFIFGSAQKANYRIFLTIKRMVETEALMKKNTSDLSNKTLDSAISDLDKAKIALTNAKNSSDISQSTKDEINIRVANLKKFAISLINQYPSYKNKLQTILDKLNSLRI